MMIRNAVFALLVGVLVSGCSPELSEPSPKSSSNEVPRRPVRQRKVNDGLTKDDIIKVEQVVRKNPNNIRAHEILRDYYKSKDKEKAFLSMRALTRIDASNMSYQMGLMEMLVENGKEKEAKALWLQLKKPAEDEIKYRKDIQKAEKDVARNPDNIAAHTALFHHYRAGNKPKAVNHARQILRLQPYNRFMKLQLAALLFQTKQSGEAKKLYQQLATQEDRIGRVAERQLARNFKR